MIRQPARRWPAFAALPAAAFAALPATAFAALLATAFAALLAIALAVPTQVLAQDQRSKAEFFENKIRPILANHCWECHSGKAGESEGSLRLDHGTLIIKGGDSGPALNPGKPDDSLLYQAINHQGYEMPPDGKLSPEEIAHIKEWITDGAFWPEEPMPDDASNQSAFDLTARKNSHWVWQPLGNTLPPAIAQNGSLNTPVDAYIRNQLQSSQLLPNPSADRVSLVRRLFLDLIGLPPQPEELSRLVSDPDIDWYSKLIDRLLADPQFGVRWARHWLDLVRYAQSRGHEFDEDIPAAEAYRDYVVRALNVDLPYDRFVVEHIAGDLLPSPRLHAANGFNESVLATGFWHLGEWVHSPVDTRKDETDRFDNMVDVFSKTFLGVTVACARCHDHKFDAIGTEDYYAMYGYLRSSHYRLVRYETDPMHRKAAVELESLRVPLQQAFDASLRSIATSLIHELQACDPEQDRYRELTNRLVQCNAIAQSILQPNDPRVRFDARSIDSRLWQSDSVVYGSTSNRPLSVTLQPQDKKPTWTIHRFQEAARDPFWNAMTQDVPAVNRQNRYSQIPEAGKILPTQSFTLETGKLSYLVRGSFRAFAAVDSHRLIAGPLHGETLLESQADNDEYRWVTHALDRYRGKTVYLEFSPVQDKPFAIVQVVDGLPPEVASAPRETQTPTAIVAQARDALELWVDHPERLNRDQAAQCATLLEYVVNADTAWLGDAKAPCNELRELAVQWQTSQQQLASRLPWHSKLALAMRDGSGVNDHVLIRGNHSRPGKEIPRRILESLDPSKAPYEGPGSGRLELAEQLVQRDNPLVARVIVNRLWHHLLGRGIAPTTDDFGALGIPPSHPELLDALAGQMMDHDWSIKSTIRAICLSSTYQQDSRPSPQALSVDPDNALLSHARVRRLEAEAIRDSLLATTGELDLRWLQDSTLSVPVYLTDFLEGRGRPGRNGPIDGHGRRSLYLEVRRNFLNPMMTAFDSPTPFSAMGRRNVSNVPAQALILLNDPLVHALAERWAARILETTPDDQQRVGNMMRAVTSREPSPDQLEMALEFIRSPEFSSEAEAYRSLAHMLLNSKEMFFRF